MSAIELPVETPKPPTYLDEAAKAEWSWICDQAKRLGIISILDKSILALYCTVYSRRLAAEEILKTEGRVYESKDGKKRTNPWQRIADVCEARLRLLCADLGFTPTARNKVRVKITPTEDKVSKYLKGLTKNED